ncbi:hypothetical protein JOD63_002975 [Microbacterium terrae]|uniref:Uncharacterized protein n=1 Tax=Microbacterium terrae TaxID=69369 RepID=A0A0M2H284_9MICO|nr:hypothetical protein [Microbacterium terrae]KJL38352.1 hypothetical protein RS81_02623 [Microbacterium terrae]MBP1079007.1 hypothetical protein [Microbacterium terrae]GLJ98407.1 hypothetical protein GCM10017594_16040 [Microbacterium terrae]
MTESRDPDAAGPPRRPDARDRRILTLTITAIVLGGYVVWQLIGLVTVKDVPPPSWLITAPAGASVVGEPRVTREPYRATTYVTVRPAEGQKAHQLVAEMGLSEQPTQIGPTPLDWRPVWVYTRPTEDGVEIRLVYLRDSGELITP